MMIFQLHKIQELLIHYNL